jgi:hypothetical protein
MNLSSFPKITDEGSKVDDHSSKFDLGVPDDLDVLVELRNWLFALEGTEEVGDCFTPTCGDDRISREEKCWHSTFRNLHVSGKSSDRLNLGGTGKVSSKRAFPVERFTVHDCYAFGFQFGISFRL